VQPVVELDAAGAHWGVLHGLQRDATQNGKIVRIRAPRDDGRIVTVPLYGEKIAARAENLRELLADYNGLAAGNVLVRDGLEVALLGFDSVTRRWAFEVNVPLEDGSVEPDRRWLPEDSIRREFHIVCRFVLEGD
jgi:hypothetical protein